MSTNDPLVGRVLDGRYEICSRIARGGMATVYVAQDTRLGRTVAIKVMHEGLGDDRDFTRKFDREARAAARLTHPHIVAVFDQGSDGGRPYIVMEYVAGQTLRSVISRDAPLVPTRALALMEPVLAALAVAHENGLVHRDVKPENVLISQRGQVKVADFGLAKAISGDTVTATQGLLIGTVSYIPPELVADGRADARSDVYSAGVVLFELLTGRKPHTGDTPIQVAYAHCNKDIPPPSTLLQGHWLTDRDAVPPYVDALVQTATSRDPDLRPADARAFLERLRLARQALADGVMNDARLDERMRGVGPRSGASAVPVPDPALAAAARDEGLDPDAEPTAVTPPVHRWVARPRTDRDVPSSTPISPVDAHLVDAVPSYRSHRTPTQARTPVERSLRLPKAPPVVVARPARPVRRHGATSARRHRRARGLASWLLVLLLTLGIGYGSWYALAGQWTTTPALTSMTREQAWQAATSAKLQLDVHEEYSEDVPAGQVARTDPAAGDRTRAGGTVAVWISRGPERHPAPGLVGLTRGDAVAAIEAANLAVGEVTEAFSSGQPRGVVVDASVAEGTQLKRDTPVDLVVSKGPAPIDVTAWVGRGADEARAALTKAGFVVAVTEQHSRTAPAGQVISQTPQGGVGKKGDTIRLVISKGPVQVVVPNTRGMQQDSAKQALAAKGFTVVVKQLPNAAPFGTVSYSEPAGGAQAAEGATVTIYVV